MDMLTRLRNRRGLSLMAKHSNGSGVMPNRCAAFTIS